MRSSPSLVHVAAKLQASRALTVTTARRQARNWAVRGAKLNDGSIVKLRRQRRGVGVEGRLHRAACPYFYRHVETGDQLRHADRRERYRRAAMKACSVRLKLKMGACNLDSLSLSLSLSHTQKTNNTHTHTHVPVVTKDWKLQFVRRSYAEGDGRRRS
ncbi:hypothetical protein L7F22_041571 [Adiantum nelumboides]|nr:hypothetical protein [Adiantum nelumboides]